MSNLQTTNKIVHKILSEKKLTRDSDNLLICCVYEEIYPGIMNKSFAEVLLRREELDLPSFETIRRNRQYEQAKYPELRANDKVRSFRSIKEEEFKEYFGANANR